MRSDPPGRGTPLAQLAGLLANAAGGARPTSVELAELVWLAGLMKSPAEDAPPDASGSDDVSPPLPPTPPPVGPEHPPTAPSTPPAEGRVPLRLPAMPHGPDDLPGVPPGNPPDGTSPSDVQGSGSGATPLRVPVPPMVTHPLTLQRALRPLKRRAPSPVGQVIDEEATAHRIARLGGHPRGWLPVLRPAEERWLRLCLIHDAGPTMPIWRPLVHELHTALAQSGIFRTVELHRAAPDGTIPPQAAHAPATGRTVTLVISDCMGPQWRDGDAGTRWYRTLRRWAKQMPLAVIQPLPERLWRTTALPTTPGLLSAPHRAAPSGALTFTPYADDVPPSDAVPVPVLEPSGAWLSHWAALVAGGGGSQLPGAVGWLGCAPIPAEEDTEAGVEDVTRLSPEELVLHFRSTASPEAFRLAGHLAVGEPQLPVMRLVQAAVEERPRPQHLAEVILSGMLTEAAGGAPGAYDFRDGVRELLLRTLPRTARGRTRGLLARIGGLIDERAGVAPGELRALASAPGRGKGPETPVGEPFATVTPESVRQLGGAGRTELLGGRYRLREQIGQSGRVWLAEDQREDGRRPVVVQRYPQAPQWLRLDFTRAARQLSRFRHPHVATVRDYANGEVPYLVMEFAEGPDLHDALHSSSHSVPVDRLVELLPRLAEAVTALHGAGIAHGALSPANVRVPRNGPVLCGFGLTPYSEESRAADLQALGSIARDVLQADEPVLRVGLPPPAFSLPGTAHTALTSAVRDLTSSDPVTQQRGVEQLELASLALHTRTYSLLGPLTVTRNGRTLEIVAPRERAMLCMLLLKEGRGVTHAELAAGIWGSDPPANSEHLLALCASRLREALGPDSVTGDGDGYALPLPPNADGVDLSRCWQLAAAAESSRRQEDIDGALRLVQSALDLWRGDPLDDIRGPAAEMARTNIASLRASLFRMRQELRQELRPSVQQASELDELLQEFPHTEDEVLTPHEELPSAQLDDLGVSRELPDDQPTPPGTTLAFEYVTRPSGTQSETLHKLGRAISHLLIHGGIGPDRFEMRPRQRGWDVTVSAEVHVLHVLTTMVNELPGALDEFPVLGLGVTLTHEPDPTVSAPTFPSGLRHLINRADTRAVVIVSNDLHERLNRSGRLRNTRFAPVPQSDDWYCEVTTEQPANSHHTTVDALILGFDGTLARLYSPSAAREAARSLTALIAERRDPESALAGEPLLPGGGPVRPMGDAVHPVDVLHAFPHHPELHMELHTRLEYIEMQAALTAKPTPHVANVLHTLSGPENPLRLAIATDASPRAVTAYLGAKGLYLPGVGIHGRTPELALLMPDVDCLRRALEQLGSPADRCVMAGSSPVEATAAQSLGIPFIGYAPDRRARERLTAAGVHITVSSLSQLPDRLLNL
ncbi:SAV_2336 N-terminal domain-related protein [Streptomyces sp. NPDC048441]|uniref:SAV_2336 N-terminal domain-related protein n=1 Tax=Streptomyces sp. NPDC048441 TaxID=3365552 RepID=UPI0037242CB5